MTNGRRVAKPRTSAEALSALSDLLTFLQVLPIPATAVESWMKLLSARAVTGGDIFDLQIVGTMQTNGIGRIYTFNTDDFESFAGLSVVTP